jgi:putative acetyltransferase
MNGVLRVATRADIAGPFGVRYAVREERGQVRLDLDLMQHRMLSSTRRPDDRSRPFMHIKPDDLTGPEIHALLAEHLHAMHALGPPESVHALDLERLRQPGIAFWTAWDEGELLGCGALRRMDDESAEIKSMRTATAHLRRGVARAMLEHIVDEARRRGYRRLWLETGSVAAFEPAHRLYASCGFAFCGPFADYVLDVNSVFMTRTL